MQLGTDFFTAFSTYAIGIAAVVDAIVAVVVCRWNFAPVEATLFCIGVTNPMLHLLLLLMLLVLLLQLLSSINEIIVFVLLLRPQLLLPSYCCYHICWCCFCCCSTIDHTFLYWCYKCCYFWPCYYYCALSINVSKLIFLCHCYNRYWCCKNCCCWLCWCYGYSWNSCCCCCCCTCCCRSSFWSTLPHSGPDN